MNMPELESLCRRMPRAVTERADQLSRLVRRGAADDRTLLIVGTPHAEEPWHLAAHLDLAARIGGLPNLSPTLVRHEVPPGAPAHLAVPLDRLSAGHRNDTVLVIAPTYPGSQLMDRLQIARRRGALIVNVESRPSDVSSLAHESLTLDMPDWPAETAAVLDQRAEVVQHVIGSVRPRSRFRVLAGRFA